MSDRYKQNIKVFIDFDEYCRPKCMCMRAKKMCSKKCTPEVVERDPYRGWEDCFKVDKYGKSKGSR